MEFRKWIIVGLFLAFINFALNIGLLWLLEISFQTDPIPNADLVYSLPLIFINLLKGDFAIFIYFLIGPILGLLFSKTVREKGHFKEIKENIIVIILAILIVFVLHIFLHSAPPKLFPYTFESGPRDCSKYANHVLADRCSGGKAIQEQNTAACDKIPEEAPGISFYQDVCYNNVAVASHNPSICKGHPNQIAMCKAEALRDSVLCDEIIPDLIVDGVAFSNTAAECKQAVVQRIELDKASPTETK